MIKLIFNTLIDLSFLKDFEQLEDVESSGKEQIKTKKGAKGKPREIKSSNSKEGTQSSDFEKENHKGNRTSDSEEYLTAESSVSGEDEDESKEDGSSDSEATEKVSSSPEY